MAYPSVAIECKTVQPHRPAECLPETVQSFIAAFAWLEQEAQQLELSEGLEVGQCEMAEDDLLADPMCSLCP